MTYIDDHSTKTQPTSTAQRAIWIGQAMEPDNSAYNVAIRVDIEGELDVHRFEQAILSTLRVVDSLNAYYLQQNEAEFELVQHIHAHYPEKINLIDLREALDAEHEISIWTTKDLSVAIDLALDPIFCFCIFHISTNQYVLYFRCHHIALDAYGLALVLQRIEQTYNASLDAKTTAICDFESQQIVVDDECHYAKSEHYKRDQDFWFAYMADIQEVVSFVSKSTLPAPTVLRRDFVIAYEQVELIERLASHHKTNNAFIVLSALAVYLSQMTNTQDIVLGLPMMARMSQKSLMVPTTLANILPLRLRFTESASWSQIIKLVIEQMSLIKNYQYYRAETLRQQLKLIGGNRRLVGPTFNIDIFPTNMWLKNCHSSIHPLSTGPINDFAVTLKMKRNDGTLPLLMMANTRSYDETRFSNCSVGLFDFLSEFLKKNDEEMRGL